MREGTTTAFLVDFPRIHERRAEALSDALRWPGIGGRFLRSQYASIEVALMNQFEKDLSANLASGVVEIYGYASRVGSSLGYYLRPSLAVDFGVFCEAADPRQLPTDFEFGRIRGYRVLRKKNNLEVDRWRLKECTFEPITIPLGNLRPQASLSEIEDILWNGYVDPPRHVSRATLLAMTSAPAGTGRLGGLTAALMPSGDAVRSTQSVLLQDLKRAVPADLTFENRIRITVEKVGRFEIAPFPWSMRNLSSIAQQESLINRIGRKDSLEEVTVGFSASSSTPSSLGEIWMKNAHFPVLVDNMFRRHSAPQKENLELAKFMITVHSLYPYAEREVEDNLLQLVQGELIKLRKEHDPNGYDDLVNLDVRTGSPRMILGIAKSLARVSGIQAVSTGEIQSALEQFVETRHELADSWIERGYDHNMEHMSTELKLRSIGRSATQIYRFLVEHPGSLRAEIRERFPKIQESVLNTILDEMVRLGVAS